MSTKHRKNTKETMQKRTSRFSPFLILLLSAASLVIVAFGAMQARAIINPILLAFILSILFVPLQESLQRRGVPDWLALSIMIIIVLVVLGLFIFVTVVSVTSLINQIPVYSLQLQQIIDDLLIAADGLPLDLDRLLRFEVLEIPQLMNITSNLLRGLLDTLLNWLFIILLIPFMLSDFAKLPKKIHSITVQDAHLQIIADLFQDIRRYVSITTQTGLLTGVMNAVFLIALGVDFAVLWGLLGFLMNYIPNLGIILSIVPPALLALVEFGWVRMLVVIGGYIATNALIENILKPRMLGTDLNISPLVVLISLIGWGYILGPAGTILAVPLTIIAIKLVLERAESMRWLEVLMSANPPPPEDYPADQSN